MIVVRITVGQVPDIPPLSGIYDHVTFAGQDLLGEYYSYYYYYYYYYYHCYYYYCYY